MLIADSKDQASIDRVVSQAKVIIACNGPYAVLGTPVVDACVRLGAHYVDITGGNKPGSWVVRGLHVLRTHA